VVAEHEGSKQVTRKPTNGHDPESGLSTSVPYNCISVKSTYNIVASNL